MGIIATYDGKIFHNPSNKFCIVIVKTADTSVPEQARDKRRYKDHLIRFTAVGYEIPMTDAVELELEGEWVNGKYGMQLQVEQWREVVPKTKEGVLSYLGSGLIKGIGEKTAVEIVAKFGTNTLDVLEKNPERLLEVRGITENKLEDIRTSFAESRALRDIMTLLAPFKLTPKTALKIYQYFGPACLDILKKSPFELCQIPGFGFRRVDAIVRKTDNRPRDPMRIRGALHCTLDEVKGKQGHLFLGREELRKAAFKMLNEKIDGQSCEACELNFMLDYYLETGQFDEAYSRAQPLINKQVTCYEANLRAYLKLSYYAQKAGKPEVAADMCARAEEALQGREKDEYLVLYLGVFIGYNLMTKPE